VMPAAGCSSLFSSRFFRVIFFNSSFFCFFIGFLSYDE
jgi:hypothetical protein